MPISRQWNIEPHCCAWCGGRVLSDVADVGHVRCADCGAEDGNGVKSICWCGAGSQLGDAPLTIHCGPNPDKSGSNMAEIVALQGPPPDPTSTRRKSAGRR